MKKSQEPENSLVTKPQYMYIYEIRESIQNIQQHIKLKCNLSDIKYVFKN